MEKKRLFSLEKTSIVIMLFSIIMLLRVLNEPTYIEVALNIDDKTTVIYRDNLDTIANYSHYYPGIENKKFDIKVYKIVNKDTFPVTYFLDIKKDFFTVKTRSL